jgi:hypothetical protein
MIRQRNKQTGVKIILVVAIWFVMAIIISAAAWVGWFYMAWKLFGLFIEGMPSVTPGQCLMGAIVMGIVSITQWVAGKIAIHAIKRLPDHKTL